MAFTRISITLPRDVLAAADRRARALDRSRSWLIVAAIRAYLAESPSRVREPNATEDGGTSPGLGPLRLAQLESDLRLTPERRVRAAEENARLGELVRGARGRRNRVLSFDRYEDYVEWKRRDDAVP
ncbi:MAG TPA: ribbon-helix-helix protein, CopG family [Gemmatimonadales bacterium]|nr:ribbon-helix-helix protein, CopG family [Gemmatimonadales bacterium]